MKPLDKEQIQKDIHRIMQNDKVLAESFEKNKDAIFRKYSHEFAKPELPPELAEAVSSDLAEIPDGIPIQESIVMAHLRPVMMIQDNQLVPRFDGPDVEVWKDRLMSVKGIIDSVIPSVGRVEVKKNAVYKWVGTGWLVDKDIIVTNRHVAGIFAQNREGFAFKMGYPDGRQSANMDFLEEYQRNTSFEFDIDSVLWIAPNDDSEPDIAFLKVKNGSNGLKLPSPIELADTTEVGETVITIGYPARDARIPDQDLVLKVFGNVYDKKRLAPGEVTSVTDSELQHDCSTLGGNSGSIVYSLNTRKAVGLHFAGLYMQANYAVRAKVVADLLKKVKAGTLTRMKGNESSNLKQTNNTNPLTLTNNQLTWEGNIPIKITIEVGGLVSTATIAPSNGKTSVGLGATGSGAKDQFENVLAQVKQKYSDQKAVIAIEEGYRFRSGWITDEKVVVIEVSDKQKSSELMVPDQLNGVGIVIRTASVSDQLESMGVELPVLEVIPAPGSYREPSNVSLQRYTDEPMQAVFHVSPDSAWPNLKDFIGRVDKKMTGTIYEWESEHISEAIFNAISKPGAELRMVTQYNGTYDAVMEMKKKLGRKFKHVWASVGHNGEIVPTAYHIKVVSRDDEEFWLSSGNWKNSNQDDIDPAGEDSTAITPLRTKNREWHAIIKHNGLAKMFRQFIEWDFKEATRVPYVEAPLPAVFLFVPVKAEKAELERRGLGRYFKPKKIDRIIDIEPLLTPDRNDRGQRMFIKAATDMVKRATKTIDIENQSFSLLDDNDEEYERFYNAILKKQEEGLDVRIIFRDPREFSAVKGQLTLEKQLTRLKKFGLNTDNMKVQRCCHTKAIIIDSSLEGKGEVLFGSHNLTTSGALYNRDASLLVRDTEVAQYFQQIFNFDWEVLASQTIEESVDITVAQPGVETPSGYKKVSLAEYMEMYEE